MSFNEKVDELVSAGYEFNVGEYVDQGWQMFKDNAGVFIGYNLLLALITNVISGVLSFIPFIGPIAGAIISIPFNIGFFIVLMKITREEEFSINDLFAGFQFFGPLVGTSLLGDY